MLAKITHLLEKHIGIQRLRFDGEQEQQFLDYYSSSFMHHRRLMACLAFLMIALMGPYEVWIFGDAWQQQALLKYGLGIPFASAIGYLIVSKHFAANQQNILTFCCLFFTAVLTAILSVGPDIATKLYQPAYLMLCFFVGSVVRLLVSRVIFILIITQIAFNVLIMWIHPQSAKLIVSYNMFYMGSAVMALACNYYMEQSVRREFLRTQELHQLANTDPLTSLYNRRHMEENFAREWMRCTRQQEQLSLLMIDIDHFKLYNDHYGHQAGDRCLIKVAQYIQSSFKRSADMVARYGGEEFIVLLPDTSADDARQLSEQLCANMAQLSIPHTASNTAAHVTISIGIANTTPQRNENYEGLMKLADEALYQAKEQGRNRAIVI